MLFACMRAELMKLKRSFIWSVFLILPVISTIMGCFNYIQNTDIVGVSWYSLWTQTTLFYSNFFYAPLIAVYCAYLWRLENFNRNRNALALVALEGHELLSLRVLRAGAVGQGQRNA